MALANSGSTAVPPGEPAVPPAILGSDPPAVKPPAAPGSDSPAAPGGDAPTAAPVKPPAVQPGPENSPFPPPIHDIK
uniref:Uncharacterized protein n=1 Tax=Setaria viridis TaxID=4556 RepID=A0A4U6V427_SETVI|nr:hypothetical protein SEVIR_4G242200v2 [Setaria viridis]